MVLECQETMIFLIDSRWVVVGLTQLSVNLNFILQVQVGNKPNNSIPDIIIVIPYIYIYMILYIHI